MSDSDETFAKSLLLQFRQLASATRSSSRVQHEFTVPCGFSTSFFTTGVCGVNFGFDISKRFLSANASIANGHYFVAGASPTSSTSVAVNVFDVNSLSLQNGIFTVIVY